MLNFKPILPLDRCWLQPILDRTPDLCCDCSVSCMVMWGQASIAACGAYFVPLVHYGDKLIYLRPLGGENFAEILPLILEDSRQRKIPFVMAGITPSIRAYLEQTTCFEFQLQPDCSDYIYTIASLAELNGHKYQSKRNHIHRFELDYPDWSSESITTDNLAECRAMTAMWYRDHDACQTGIAMEQQALSTAFDHYEAFGFEGLAIRVNGQIVAYSMGMPLNQTTFDVNFEKAFGAIPGAYAIINREFARMIRRKYPEIRFLNREDDMGLAGLRKAKLSYHPAVLLEKYTATLPAANRA